MYKCSSPVARTNASRLATRCAPKRACSKLLLDEDVPVLDANGLGEHASVTSIEHDVEAIRLAVAHGGVDEWAVSDVAVPDVRSDSEGPMPRSVWRRARRLLGRSLTIAGPESDCQQYQRQSEQAKDEQANQQRPISEVIGIGHRVVGRRCIGVERLFGGAFIAPLDLDLDILLDGSGARTLNGVFGGNRDVGGGSSGASVAPSDLDLDALLHGRLGGLDGLLGRGRGAGAAGFRRTARVGLRVEVGGEHGDEHGDGDEKGFHFRSSQTCSSDYALSGSQILGIRKRKAVD